MIDKDYGLRLRKKVPSFTLCTYTGLAPETFMPYPRSLRFTTTCTTTGWLWESIREPGLPAGDAVGGNVRLLDPFEEWSLQLKDILLYKAKHKI